MNKKELTEKTVTELRAVAKDLDINLKTRSKAEIVDEIIKEAKRAGKGTEEKTAVISAGKTVKKAAARKTVKAAKPGQSGDAPVAPLMKIPSGAASEESRVTAIAVDPRQVFVYWELREETALRGTPALRVYDVTGIDFDGKNALAFFDVPLSSTSGSTYLDVVPAREFVLEVGVIGPGGGFEPEKRSGKLLMPPERPYGGEAKLPEKYFEFTPVTSY